MHSHVSSAVMLIGLIYCCKAKDTTVLQGTKLEGVFHSTSSNMH